MKVYKMVEQNKEQKLPIWKMEIVYLVVYLVCVFACKPYASVILFLVGSLLFILIYIFMPKKTLSKAKKRFYQWMLFSINQIIICVLYLLHIFYERLNTSEFIILNIVMFIVLVLGITICYKSIGQLKRLYKENKLDVKLYKEKQKIKKEKAERNAVPAALIGLGLSKVANGNIYFVAIIILFFIMILSAFYFIYDYYYKYLINE